MSFLKPRPIRRLIPWCSLVLPAIAALAHAQTTVDNPAEPEQGGGVRTLVELWRISPFDEDLLLGQVIRATADSAGNVYLLDAQLNHVEVIAPDGSHVGTIGGEGEGPGEMRGPAGVLRMPGDRLAVVTRFPGRLLTYDAAGAPLRSIMLTPRQATEGGYTAVHFATPAGEDLVVVGNDVSQAEVGEGRTWYVGRYDKQGVERVRYFARDVVLDFTQPRLVERDIIDTIVFACAADRDRVYLAPVRDEYRINVYRADGDLERVITREFRNRRREERELRRMHGVFEALTRHRPDEVSFEIEELAATISGLWVAPDGRLWVQHSRSGEAQPAGVFRAYDVFDSAGVFVRQESLICEGDSFRDELFFLDSHLVLLIKDYWETFYSQMGYVPDASAEEARGGLICYRLPEGR